MSEFVNEKYFARAGECKFPTNTPSIPEAINPVLWFDADLIPETTMASGTFWIMEPFETTEMVAHDTDSMMFFCGPDRENPEELYADIQITLGNDVLHISHTGALYIPKGVPVGNFKATRVDRPVMSFFAQFAAKHWSAEVVEGIPDAEKFPASAYSNHYVERYEPTSGIIPEAPEGFLQLLVWLAGDKVEGAPYLELCRFMTPNPTGPASHVHPEEEFIGFIGTDPDNPEDLGAEVHFWLGDEEIPTTKSTVIFVPGNLKHAPLTVPSLNREAIHFSGSCATEYIREDV